MYEHQCRLSLPKPHGPFWGNAQSPDEIAALMQVTIVDASAVVVMSIKTALALGCYPETSYGSCSCIDLHPYDCQLEAWQDRHQDHASWERVQQIASITSHSRWYPCDPGSLYRLVPDDRCRLQVLGNDGFDSWNLLADAEYTAFQAMIAYAPLSTKVFGSKRVWARLKLFTRLFFNAHSLCRARGT